MKNLREGRMTYEEWEDIVPREIKDDSLWRVEAYRLGLFLSDLAWADANRLLKNRRTTGIADQLFRAAGNISSSIGEGFSRDTGKARSTFYEYALGSARETRVWYFKSRHELTDKVSSHRIGMTTQIIKLLLTMIRTERRTNRRVSD
jgi:four helix bundle protein